MAATGTPTPNIGLRRAQGTDPASVDDINYNSELLDTKLGAVGDTSVQGQIDALSASTAQTFGNVQDGLAIVSNGNTHVAIPAGYWVYVKGHGTLSEGLYKNTSGATIAANATLSTSNLTADPNGGLNSVYDTLNSKVRDIARRQYQSKYCQATAGTLEISNIPDGVYIITVVGKTQSSQKYISVYIDDQNHSYDDGFASYITPVNNGNYVLTYSYSFAKAYNSGGSNTLTATYSADWYKMYVMIEKVQAWA